jgi:hypothetical protein
LGAGVGEPPRKVRLLTFRDIAAVVSSVDADHIGESAGAKALRRDMAAHTDVLNRVLDDRTVLPSRFGVVFPDDRTLVEELLAPQHDELLERLNALKGTIELALTAQYVEDKVLREVMNQQPHLMPRADSAGNSYSRRLDLGARIAEAIRAKRDSAAESIVKRLVPLARDVAIAEEGSDLTVLRASFLVDRVQLNRFDRALERLQAEAGEAIQLSCVGPLPPYSFVDLRITAGAG